MKGDLLGDCPVQNQKDIYFLETNIKSESANLANLFAPTNDTRTTEMFKYKPRPKLKQKLYPTLEFFVQNKSTSDSQNKDPKCRTESGSEKISKSNEEAGPSASSPSESRRNSLDLYREAASILGLTCQQTDDCECLECQCHYFDFDEDTDFSSTGGEYLITSGVSGTSSTCCIQ
ncbi:uncharacterized protein LOC123307682 [Coccinella septempunctata]|uniref:uncharacterized protein LOC123307682 n=1 Tax=Coccinella septempunctata TaxID=41139 RepID=UPI001D07B6E5|nr:uncharacterized protein LOC123307682 [Coccinella septempunctata]